jgi:hypothetical protein
MPNPPDLEQLFPWPDSADGEVFENTHGVGLRIRWSLNGIGFGELTLHRTNAGRWQVDEEYIGEAAVVRILRALVAKGEPT